MTRAIPLLKLQDLRVEPLEMKLRKDNQRVLLNDLKLIFVLGLDHTLIHSTTLSDFIPREPYVIPPVYEGEGKKKKTAVFPTNRKFMLF